MQSSTPPDPGYYECGSVVVGSMFFVAHICCVCVESCRDQILKKYSLAKISK